MFPLDFSVDRMKWIWFHEFVRLKIQKHNVSFDQSIYHHEMPFRGSTHKKSRSTIWNWHMPNQFERTTANTWKKTTNIYVKRKTDWTVQQLIKHTSLDWPPTTKLKLYCAFSVWINVCLILFQVGRNKLCQVLYVLLLAYLSQCDLKQNVIWNWIHLRIH